MVDLGFLFRTLGTLVLVELILLVVVRVDQYGHAEVLSVYSLGWI